MNPRLLVPLLFTPLAPLALLALAIPRRRERPAVFSYRYPCVNPGTGEKRWTTNHAVPSCGLLPVIAAVLLLLVLPSPPAAADPVAYLTIGGATQDETLGPDDLVTAGARIEVPSLRFGRSARVLSTFDLEGGAGVSVLGPGVESDVLTFHLRALAGVELFGQIRLLGGLTLDSATFEALRLPSGLAGSAIITRPVVALAWAPRDRFLVEGSYAFEDDELRSRAATLRARYTNDRRWLSGYEAQFTTYGGGNLAGGSRVDFRLFVVRIGGGR